MNQHNIIDALGRIDDSMIYQVEKLRFKKQKSVWVKWGAMIACLCLVMIGVLLWQSFPLNTIPGSDMDINKEAILVDENGVTIPKMDISLSANVEADMLAFFIYQGNCYVQYEWLYDNTDIVGEYVGTATGLIDEWTEKDGYVEYAGSVQGDFYTVKGCAPSFMLCMQYESGAVSTYICNTGITLKYGEELYEDRLNLSENCRAISYETRQSWNYGENEIYQLDTIHMPVVTEFMEQLNQAEFVPWTTVVEKEEKTHSSIYEKELYHMYFDMNNGMKVHLRLYENGYIRFQGILDVCVQIPQESFDALISLLKKN